MGNKPTYWDLTIRSRIKPNILLKWLIKKDILDFNYSTDITDNGVVYIIEFKNACWVNNLKYIVKLLNKDKVDDKPMLWDLLLRCRTTPSKLLKWLITSQLTFKYDPTTINVILYYCIEFKDMCGNSTLKKIAKSLEMDIIDGT